MQSYFYVYPFGADGETTDVPTDNPGTGEVSYQQGWTVNYQRDLETDPTALPVPRQKSNSLMFNVTDNIRQYQTQGFPEWITADDNNPGGTPTPFEYDLHAIVRHDDGSGVKIYENLEQGNTDEPGVNVSSWLELSNNAQGNPPGTVIDFAGTSPPAGYLECDGQEISRTTYSRLFDAIGTTWGAGDGSTTFLVPNMNGYTTIGRNGATSSVPNTPGSRGGATAVSLAPSQMPAHTHSYQNLFAGGGSTSGPGPFVAATGYVNRNTGSSGSGASHNNMQPSAVVLKCIKF